MQIEIDERRGASGRLPDKKMRLYIINSGWGSGGPDTVASELYYVAENSGHTVRYASARGNVPDSINHYQIGNQADVYLHALSARLFDNMGKMSRRATSGLIQDIESYKPDVISIQDPLGYTMNIPMLFDYIRRSGRQTYWTLHDCWAFTGHCIAGLCDRLDKGCGDCPRKREYPKSIGIDNSKGNYLLKKKVFSGISNLFLITPSKWLSGLVGKSFLKDYSVKVIPNGIDLTVFKPTESDLRRKYGLEKKQIVLGVAGVWSETKGMYHFYELADRLDDKYQCVMIGRNQDTSAANVIHIDRTSDRKELCGWYTAADVFVNPTLADNFPTVNLEALACGTPVITFATGGSPESVGKCGLVVGQGDGEGLVRAVYDIGKMGITSAQCQEQAKAYDKWQRYAEYLEFFSGNCVEKNGEEQSK